MGVFKASVWLVAAAAAGAAYVASGEALPGDELLLSSAEERPAPAVAQQFRIVLSGRDTDCSIQRGESLSERKARLVFGAGCLAEMPQLAKVRYWSENADGSVAFTGEDGKVAVSFAAGDGPAFESYGAGTPLISLIAED